MAGDISLSLEREPNYFHGAGVEGGKHRVIVLREDTTDRIACMGACSVATAFVNGQETRLGYLSQLRLDRQHRGQASLIVVGHKKFQQIHDQEGLADLYISAIVADNEPARRLLEHGATGLPKYEPFEPFSTLAIPITRRQRSRSPRDVQIRPGRSEDLDGIVSCLRRNLIRYQFGRAWTVEDFSSPERSRGLSHQDVFIAWRRGAIVGCLARWDQRSFKQSVVREYSGRLARLRPWINMLSRLVAIPRLPPPGEPLATAFLSHLAIDDDDPEVFLALLLAVYNDSLGHDLDYLVIGFASRNPFLQAVRRTFHCREYKSVIYLVHWQGGPAPINLDGRCPHLEVALL